MSRYKMIFGIFLGLLIANDVTKAESGSYKKPKKVTETFSSDSECCFNNPDNLIIDLADRSGISVNRQEVPQVTSSSTSRVIVMPSNQATSWSAPQQSSWVTTGQQGPVSSQSSWSSWSALSTGQRGPVSSQSSWSSWSAPSTWSAPETSYVQPRSYWSSPVGLSSKQTSWSVPRQTYRGLSGGLSVTVPTWRKSFTPVSGQTGCYNQCRPACGNTNVCQPACQTTCNIQPTCGRRSQVQYAGPTLVCGRPGYNLQQNMGTFFV